jgi:hypothetical protein
LGFHPGTHDPALSIPRETDTNQDFEQLHKVEFLLFPSLAGSFDNRSDASIVLRLFSGTLPVALRGFPPEFILIGKAYLYTSAETFDIGA